MAQPGFTTQSIHGKTLKEDAHRAIKFPIYAGVAYDFASAEDLEAAFLGRKPEHAYSRITNPTVEAFEHKVTALEQAFASVAVASGMAAATTVFLNLLQQGDHVVASSSLFGGTISLLQNVLQPFGIATTFADIDSLHAIEQALQENTRIIFFETISNPKMNVPDIARIVELAHSRNIVVVVDGTMTTPYLFDAKAFGVDIVIHSSTKAISGGATSVGGVIVDMGLYNWKTVPALQRFHRFGKFAFVARLRKEVYRETGACLSPFHAYLQSLGLETLALRMQRSCDNTLRVAEFLAHQSDVVKVNYPGLPDSPYHEIARQQFPKGSGTVFSFELQDKAACFAFLNALQLIRRATNLADNTSLIIHPASTIFVQFSLEERLSMGVPEGLIRLSVGIEDIEDVIADISQALERK